MNRSRRTTVSIITTGNSHYRAPLFKNLAELLTIHDGTSLHVLGTTRTVWLHQWTTDLQLSEGYHYEALPSWRLSKRHSHRQLNPTLFRRLASLRPRVVVSAGFSIPTLIAAIYCRNSGTPLVIWSGGTAWTERYSGRGKLALRKALVHSASAFISYGTDASRYLVSLGARPGSVFPAYNAVDNARIRELYSAVEGTHAARNNPCKVLYVGRLVRGKGVELLLECVATLLRTNGIGLQLGIVGDGPQRRELELIAKCRLPPSLVEFDGYLEQAEVVRSYSRADVLVFPSLIDPWGLVVNEAMVCGLPVICSRMAGSCTDLIEDGQTGFAVDPRDIDSMAKAIAILVDNPEMRNRMGTAAQRTMQLFGPQRAAKAMFDACHSVLE